MSLPNWWGFFYPIPPKAIIIIVQNKAKALKIKYYAKHSKLKNPTNTVRIFNKKTDNYILLIYIIVQKRIVLL